MAQTIHNFLIHSGASTDTPLVLEPRVFDFEVSVGARDYYTSAMTYIDQQLRRGNDFINDVDARRNVADLIQVLNTWSTYKKVVNGDVTTAPTLAPFPTIGPVTGATITTTMDRYMAESLDRLVRTMRATGYDPITAYFFSIPATEGLIELLINRPTVYNATQITSLAISQAVQARVIGDATTGSQSLQQLLMVDYVSRGNELLFNEMTKLREAINLNQTALGYLNSLQDLMNQKDPQRFILALQYLNAVNIAQNVESAYNQFEVDTFKQELGAAPKFTDAQLKQYILGLNSTPDTPSLNTPPNEPTTPAQEAFKALSTTMSDAWSYNIQRIRANLDTLINQIGAAAGSTRLVQALKVIRGDFDTVGTVQDWVKDFGQGREGDYQRHINDSMVASQAFNDTQREELRRVMFVFEEFYKSATAMLSRMTQLLEKMASAINR